MDIRWYEIWQEHGNEYEIISTKKGVYTLIINGIMTLTGTKEECLAQAL